MSGKEHRKGEIVRLFIMYNLGCEYDVGKT